MIRAEARYVAAEFMFNKLTNEYIDLEDFSLANAVSRGDGPRTFQEVCAIVRELKVFARFFGDILLDAGTDFGVPYIHVTHARGHGIGKVSVYDDDNHPEYGIRASLREWWFGEEKAHG